MSQPGPKLKLDDAKRGEICGLVASGVSLRQAAQCVGCDPHTIRREMQRNEAFRQQIENSKKLIETAPFRALMEEANTNWRAAAWVLERIRPELFAKKTANALSAEDIERFVHAICDVIGECSTHSIERQRLYDLLGHVMPPEFRPAWDRQQLRRRRIRNSGIHWHLGKGDSFDKFGNPLHPVTEHSPWPQSQSRTASQFAPPPGADTLQKQAVASPPRRDEPEFASPPATKPSNFLDHEDSGEANSVAIRLENEFHRAEQNAEAWNTESPAILTPPPAPATRPAPGHTHFPASE